MLQNHSTKMDTETRIPSGIWSRLYGWTVHGLYKSYMGLEATVAQPITGRVDWVKWAPTTNCDWTTIGPPTHFFLSRTDRNVTTWVAPRLKMNRSKLKAGVNSEKGVLTTGTCSCLVPSSPCSAPLDQCASGSAWTRPWRLHPRSTCPPRPCRLDHRLVSEYTANHISHFTTEHFVILINVTIVCWC